MVSRVGISSGGSLHGSLRVPGDKSISHRALFLAMLAEGRSVIRGLGDGADIRSTAAAVRALGARIDATTDPDEVFVDSPGWAGLTEPEDVIDAGNSGTTTRLLAGIVASRPIHTVITGDRSLRSRPMARVTEPLRAMGAAISGRRGGSLLPLSIDGTDLKAVTWVLPVASAQVKTSLILAALGAVGATTIVEPRPTRDHTERLLTAFGGEVGVTPAGPPDGPRSLIVRGGQRLHPASIDVPGDPSSAAFFLAAAAVIDGSDVTVEGVGLNPTRTGFLEVLTAMGAGVQVEPDAAAAAAPEPFGAIRVRGRRPLRGVTITPDAVPGLIDELPVLAVAAALADGRTVISGAEELRHKESDRLAGMARLVALAGAAAQMTADGLVIDGRGTRDGGHSATAVGTFDSLGDHRLAMAAAVAAVGADVNLVVDGADAAAVSYPGFWSDLASLGARVKGEADGTDA